MYKTLAITLVSLCAFAVSGQPKTIQERLGYPKNAKLVIIHADDLGVSHSENSASIDAMEKGCVNSASIMVPCPWFPEIAAYAKAHPDADFGLHITLTSEWTHYKWGPVTSQAKVPGLVNKRGFLYASVDSVIKNATPAEVEEETRNQVKRAIQFGINPTHLDAHMGTALSHLDFLKAYLKVGREFKIPVFVPRAVEAGLNVKLETITNEKDVIVDHILSASPENFKDMNGFYVNGIKNLKPGLTYLIIHTAYDNDEMQAVTINNTNWGAAWRQKDFDFFTSNECTKLLKENNVYLVTWKEIRDKITRK